MFAECFSTLNGISTAMLKVVCQFKVVKIIVLKTDVVWFLANAYTSLLSTVSELEFYLSILMTSSSWKWKIEN